MARILTVVGALLLLVGACAGWASRTLFDSRAFAAHARQSLENPDVRAVVARTIVRDVLEVNDPSLVAARPILEAVAEQVVAGETFGDLFEAAARGAHALFVNKPTDNVVLRANEAVLLFIDTLRQYAPSVAAQIPPDLDLVLVEIRDASLELELWRAADDVAWLAWVLPAAAALTWAAALWLARDRRREVEVIGWVTAAGGAVLVAVVAVGERVVAATGNDATAQRAVEAVWRSYAAGLQTLGWFGIGAGLLTTAAAIATRPEGARLTPRRLVARAGAILRPASQRPIAVIGAALVAGALGVWMIVAPDQVVEVFLGLLGLLMVYGSLIAVLELLARPSDDAAPVPRRRRRRVVGVAGGIGLVFAVVAVVLLVTESPEAQGEPVLGCNGHAVLCDRRVDQVAFAATHNSMSAADDGYLRANQSQGIAEQLERGVRGLLVDTYLATEHGGTVYTDFTDVQREKLVDSVGPDLTTRAEELRRIAGPPPDGAAQRLYLCHVFCELGGTRASDAFADLAAFLDQNRGEVVVMVIEDYAPPETIMDALEKAGLAKHLYEWSDRGRLPTLRQLIESDRRLLVMLEQQEGGRRLPNAYDALVQETPYSFPTAADLDAPTSCAANRGTAGAPLFLVNHFVTPASITESAEANTSARLEGRARRCGEERGLFPNLVAVDFVDQGDTIAAVDALNGVAASTAGP